MTAPNKPLNRGCRAIPSADVTALKALAWTVSGFKSAAQEALSRAQTVLDPFHVVLWASNMLDDCRRLVQQETLGRRGHKSDPLYKLRRTPLTRIGYLFDTSRKQLSPLFADVLHLEVNCSWSMYQRMVTVYSKPDRRRGKALMQKFIKIITATDLPRGLTEVKRLGTTLKNMPRVSLLTLTALAPATD